MREVCGEIATDRVEAKSSQLGAPPAIAVDTYLHGPETQPPPAPADQPRTAVVPASHASREVAVPSAAPTADLIRVGVAARMTSALPPSREAPKFVEFPGSQGQFFRSRPTLYLALTGNGTFHRSVRFTEDDLFGRALGCMRRAVALKMALKPLIRIGR